MKLSILCFGDFRDKSRQKKTIFISNKPNFELTFEVNNSRKFDFA